MSRFTAAAFSLALLTARSVLIAGSLLIAGCATGGVAPDSGTRSEIDELKARVIELQRKSAVSEVEIARLRQQVADLEARQGGRTAVSPSPGLARPGTSSASPSGTATRRPAAEVRSPDVGSSGREVAPAIEEADLTIEEPPSRTPPPAAGAGSRTASPGGRPSTGGSTPARPTAPAPAPRATAPPPPAPRPAPPPPARVEPADDVAPPPSSAPAEGTPSPAAQALYDRGYTLYHQGRYVDAEASFQRFLQGPPGTVTSELADNAQYWIGECRYSRGDLRGALAAFRETVERYPEGNKVPDALLKAGQTLEALGDVEGARTTYREVTRRFAGTAAAAAAEERRSRLP